MAIPHSAVSGAMLLRQLRRRCPDCGAEVMATLQKKNEIIHCPKCGCDVPPKQST
jgi:ribosomal protein S27AE